MSQPSTKSTKKILKKEKRAVRKAKRKQIRAEIKAYHPGVPTIKGKAGKDPLSVIFAAVRKDEADKGHLELDVGTAPTQDSSIQVARMSANQNQFYIASLINVLLQRCGAPSSFSLINAVDWGMQLAYVNNLIAEAARDNVPSMDKMPKFLQYYLNCINMKTQVRQSAKTINYSWSPTTIPGKIMNGTSVPQLTGLLRVGTFLDSAEGSGWIVGIGTVPPSASSVAGNFSPLIQTAATYDEAKAEADFTTIATFLSRTSFSKFAKGTGGRADTSVVVDAFNVVQDPSWTNVNNTVYGFQQTVYTTGGVKDYAIAECKVTQPNTTVTPDPRKPPDAKLITGTPLVGFQNLMLAEHMGVKSPTKVTLRPAPWSFADLLNRACKIFGLQLLGTYGPALTGLPLNLLNTLEILVIFHNLILQYFSASNAYAGTIFPAPAGRPNEFGASIDFKNYPNMAVNSISFNSVFVEWLRQIQAMTFVKMKGEKGVTILRVPVLTIDPTNNYAQGIQNAIASAGLDLSAVAAAFPTAPVTSVSNRLWGVLEPLTCSWAASFDAPDVYPVNIVNGGVVQAVTASWNKLQAQLAKVGQLSAGKSKNEATRNRVLCVAAAAPDDFPIDPISSNPSQRLVIMSECDPKLEAGDLGPDRPMRLWYEMGPTPVVFQGQIGSVSYDVTNYTSGWGFNVTIQCGGESVETKATADAVNASPAPTMGLPGSETSMSELVILWQLKGGGFTYSKSQMKVLDHLIAHPPPELKQIVEAMEREDFPRPAIAGVLRSKSVLQAIRKLKGRRVWNSVKGGLEKVGKGLWDTAKKFIPDLLGV